MWDNTSMRKILWVLTTAFIVIGFVACDRGKQNLNGSYQGTGGVASQGKMPKGPLKPGSYVPGEILVKFREGVGPEKTKQIVHGLGYEVKAKAVRSLRPWDRWLTVLLPEETLVREVMWKAASHAGDSGLRQEGPHRSRLRQRAGQTGSPIRQMVRQALETIEEWTRRQPLIFRILAHQAIPLYGMVVDFLI